MTAIAWLRQQWSSATTIRSSTKWEQDSTEKRAPNSESSTELPGANRSWVAMGDAPKLLQQRRRDSVKSSLNAEVKLSGPINYSTIPSKSILMSRRRIIGDARLFEG